MTRKRKRNGSRKKKPTPPPVIFEEKKTEIKKEPVTIKEKLLAISDPGDTVEYNNQIFEVEITDPVDEWNDPLRKRKKFLWWTRRQKKQ